jgi:membrane protease YdiL (CAAX protease family)
VSSANSSFSPLSTALYVAGWTLVMLQGWGPQLAGNPTGWLVDPVDTAQRIVVRDLERAEANQRTGPLRSVRSALFGSFEEVLEASIAIQRDVSVAVVDGVPSEDPGSVFLSSRNGIDATEFVQLNAGLVVLLAEAGELEAAFDLAQKHLPREVDRAVRTIYGAVAVDDPRATKPESRALESLAGTGLSDWLLERPATRLLSASGDSDSASAISQRIERRGARWQRRTEALTAANYLLMAVGAVLLTASVRGTAQRESPASTSTATPIPGPIPAPSPQSVPWSMAQGFGVLVRADFWNRLYFVSLAQLTHALSEPSWLDPFHTFGTLIASLPLLWLVHRQLLAFTPGGFFKTFGLSPKRAQLGSILCVATAALAIDLFGTTALAWGCYGLGFESHWAEGLDETLIWGSTGGVIQSCLDYLLWTPVFEELMFRGLLFYTLRNRYGAWQAAAMSAVLFSAIHFYSFPGFMMTFWSGFVWAIAFERARSLLPGILAHSVYNLFFVLGILMIYR